MADGGQGIHAKSLDSGFHIKGMVREGEEPEDDIAGYLKSGWAVLHIASAVVWTGDSSTLPLRVAPLVMLPRSLSMAGWTSTRSRRG